MPSRDATPTVEASLKGVRYVDVEVDHDNLMSSVLSLITHFFPSWSVPHDVKLIQCTAGITNKLVRCVHIPTGESALVRAYGKGSDLLIDRQQELLSILTFSNIGLCPPLHGRFRNGIVYGFIEGTPFSVDDMRDPQKSLLVASRLATWHKVNMPIDRTPRLFRTIWKWADAIPATYSNPDKQKQFQETIDLEKIKLELRDLEKRVEALKSPVVFCHNDLLSGNIVLSSDGDSVNFIDYEYGAFSYRGFDIGNHFCEYAGFECNYGHYPSRQQQLSFLRTYLQTFHSAPPTDEEVDGLYREVDVFAQCSHMFWGVWALVQAEVSDLDFDYLEYAGGRFGEYWRREGVVG
ncbi:Ethanolamine kinase [Rhizophlyctis rosea]|uniref:ethanolamine kinase n=1 Tax=Rhizophlyctis rosea TaxID=64517 RepID=A0AAD5SAK3_9FUNG|nr:Ethanolamine kinase [Rhizophlyctis rosea]